MIGLLAIAVAGDRAVAQPPPPPPPGFPDLVNLLENAFNDRKLDDYARLFRPDVKVYRDGALVADDLGAFLTIIRAEFDQNLHLFHLSWAQGGQVLVMEDVQGCVPVRTDPRIVYHPCHQARAVRYDLAADFRIAAVHILTAESAWNMHAGDVKR